MHTENNLKLQSMVKGKEFIKNLDNSQFSHFQFLFSPLLDSLASALEK